MKQLFLREYVKQILIATALSVVALPYVMLTNASSIWVILIHALLMWILTPMLITIVEVVRKRSTFSERTKYDVSSVLTVLAVTGSSTLTVIFFHFFTGIKYNILLSPALWASLLPVYFSYLLILFTRIWREQKTRELELQSQRDKASFEALAAQLKPHFLFNSLNTIEYLIDSKPKDAVVCLQNLANLYRGILDNSKKNLVSISDELIQVKNYLSIQDYRFEGKLKVEWSVDHSLLSFFIPPNLLLNCVENSCKHGVEAIGETKPIDIGISDLNSKQYSLKIGNFIPDLDERRRQKHVGFGLTDARKRLELLFGEQASMEIREESNRFEVIFTLPKRMTF